MRALLTTFSWQEWRHHPWRSASAVVAVTLGVALAFAVHLINASALAEFSGAVSAVNGQPDLEVRPGQGLLPDQILESIAAHPDVALASPVLDLASSARQAGATPIPVRVVGVDALVVGSVSPALTPVLRKGSGQRLDLFAADTVFLNPSAQQALGFSDGSPPTLELQSGLRWRTVRIAGTTNTPGPPLLVMDVAALQDLMDQTGQLSRIDLRLTPGAHPASALSALELPTGLLVQRPDLAGERTSNLSRAYRVNLTVLSLVALFTGAFLVFSVLALSVAKRQQQFALLGVLGLSARERLHLVLAESALLGLLGSALGIALGTALAGLALRLLGGDLGGGYFGGQTPVLQWTPGVAALYAALGLLAALAGGWWPARATARLAPALALKGLSTGIAPGAHRHTAALGLVVLAVALAWAPPVGGLPLAAYASVGLLLLGGIAALPAGMGLVLGQLAPRIAQHALPLLAVERSRRVRETAAVATSGVVASLALSVSLTVMVASFRDSVAAWLDGALPAQLYVRTSGDSPGNANTLPSGFVQAVSTTPGVRRVDPRRVTRLQLSPTLPAVTLLARPLASADQAHSGQQLPLIGPAQPLPLAGNGEAVVPLYVSEAMVDLYGAHPGSWMPTLGQAFLNPPPGQRFFVAGVWRDYGRQHGSIAIDRADYLRLTGDDRVNDLALHLAPGAEEDQVREAIRQHARSFGAEDLIEFASAGQIRATSLRIFDRSFAVTYWLQAVAIGIGLFGVAASFSAQVLARRKEFGLLLHLGLTRAQVLGLIAIEGLAWTVLGALAGLGLGIAVSVVLVHVVNPQSFHWTMDLSLPWLHLSALCLAVVLAGTATAWLAGRAAASRDAVQSVKEDW